ncbi:hypothetical protein GCM10011505_39000 [Tistrella bauzanensis]|uniref:Uncharacterized protein n=1 Tax=Tistrella bauzanensis TaxID=657419 RepID=A0ABQ1IZT0_9PROT|nr:hypothetical protein GCM10011505_39000 [Tistrella bauzanensis]
MMSFLRRVWRCRARIGSGPRDAAGDAGLGGAVQREAPHQDDGQDLERHRQRAIDQRQRPKAWNRRAGRSRCRGDRGVEARGLKQREGQPHAQGKRCLGGETP